MHIRACAINSLATWSDNVMAESSSSEPGSSSSTLDSSDNSGPTVAIPTILKKLKAPMLSELH